MTQAEDNKALVARYYDQVLTRGEIAVLDELLAPDFRSWLPDGAASAPGPTGTRCWPPGRRSPTWPSPCCASSAPSADPGQPTGASSGRGTRVGERPAVAASSANQTASRTAQPPGSLLK